ncbi:MAG: hypothetical protein ACRDJ9_24005, partial [Dehalococcoidia bacterium]
MNTTTRKLGKVSASPSAAARRKRGLHPAVIAGTVVGIAVIALGAIFFINNRGSESTSAGDGLAGRYAFKVGNPGPGQPAPAIQLPSTSGGMFDLASLRGQTVLLY